MVAAQTGIPIAAPADLELLRTNVTGDFFLEADIDLLGVEFLPIGTQSDPFRGSLDGNGHEIRNLTIVGAGGDQVGLFGATEGAALQDIRLQNVLVQSAGRDVGSLVGQARQTTITGCVVSGAVCGQVQVGGLVGFLGDSDVDSCRADVTVDVCDSSDTLAIWFGGLIGHAHPYRDPGVGGNSVGDGCRVTNCSALGSTRGVSVVGGFAGNFHGSFAKNCVALGDVEATRGFSGGFAGNVVDEPGVLGTPTVSVVLLDCEATGCVRALTSGGGTGSSLGFPYDATNGGFAAMIRGNLTPGGTAPAVVLERCTARGDVNSFEPFNLLPTGGFCGLIEPESMLVECRATGNVVAEHQHSVGGFVGWGGGLQERCEAHGDVVGTNRCGGFVGQATIGHNPGSATPGKLDGRYVFCAAYGNVTALSADAHSVAVPLGVGGFVGNALSQVEFTSCSASGSTIAPGGGGGGFLGHADACRLSQCSAQGPVLTQTSQCGGFAGTTTGGFGVLCIRDCFAQSDVILQGVESTSTELALGGFVGRIGSGTQIQRSYAAGTVAARGGGVGGFGGVATALSCDACFFDAEASHQGWGDPAGAVGLGTSAMRQQKAYSGWNFGDVWHIDENESYPELR